MKKTKYLRVLVGVVFMTTMLTACIEDVETTFVGAVKASPSTVSNGDEIVLSIEPLDFGGISVTVGNSVNGDNPIEAISYYIDGSWIAKSKDEDSDYSIKYTIQDLSSGTHTVSAHCEASSGNVTIHETIEECQITVE